MKNVALLTLLFGTLVGCSNKDQSSSPAVAAANTGGAAVTVVKFTDEVKCLLLDGGYVSKSVTEGKEGDLILFSQGYDGPLKPNCTKISLTQTSSVPTVSTQNIEIDKENEMGRTWKWENDKLVSYNKAEGDAAPKKAIEISLERRGEKLVIVYLAYVLPDGPPTRFEYIKVSGPQKLTP